MMKGTGLAQPSEFVQTFQAAVPYGTAFKIRPVRAGDPYFANNPSCDVAHLAQHRVQRRLKIVCQEDIDGKCVQETRLFLQPPPVGYVPYGTANAKKLPVISGN